MTGSGKQNDELGQMKKDVSVLVIDDNVTFRSSLGLLLESTRGFKLCGAFESGERVEAMLTQLEPDVILMDIDMPTINGIEVVKKVRKVDSEIPILMLTGFEDDEKVFDSICSGANGYLLKNTAPKDLLYFIREVRAGGAPMTPSVARKVLTMFKSAQTSYRPEEKFDLSNREREVLHLLVNGRSYKMIATELGISFETVHSHIKKIYKALHVNSATEAVSKVLRNPMQ